MVIVDKLLELRVELWGLAHTQCLCEGVEMVSQCFPQPQTSRLQIKTTHTISHCARQKV